MDIPSKMIYRYYAYADLDHDPAFLAEVYPAMQKNLAYLQALIPPGGYLPEEPSSFANTYDVVPVNHYDVYDSELYQLALEVVITTAQKLEQPTGTIAPLQTDLTKAKAEFEQLFWDPSTRSTATRQGRLPRTTRSCSTPSSPNRSRSSWGSRTY